MPVITRVDVLDDRTLEIELNNGSVLLFNISPFLEASASFAALCERERFQKPLTDGQCVYWRDGPRLTLEEIMNLIKKV